MNKKSDIYLEYMYYHFFKFDNRIPELLDLLGTRKKKKWLIEKIQAEVSTEGIKNYMELNK